MAHLTVGQITDKISELRSRVAIYDGLILHIQSNYIRSDHGPAEMRFTREDNAFVSQGHLESATQSFYAEIDQLRAELQQWENMSVPDPSESSGKKIKPSATTRAKRRKSNESASNRSRSAHSAQQS